MIILKKKKRAITDGEIAEIFLNKEIKGKILSTRRVTDNKYGGTVGEFNLKGGNLQELLEIEVYAEIYKKLTEYGLLNRILGESF